MVREEGVEPSSPKAGDFKSPVYTIPPLSHLITIQESKDQEAVGCSRKYFAK